MVVPWPINCTSFDCTPARSMTRLMPRTTVAARRPGSLRTLATWTSPVASRTRMTSVKVPPTSMPMRYMLFLGKKDDEVVRRPGDAHLRAGREGNVGFGARQLGDEAAAAFEPHRAAHGRAKIGGFLHGGGQALVAEDELLVAQHADHGAARGDLGAGAPVEAPVAGEHGRCTRDGHAPGFEASLDEVGVADELRHGERRRALVDLARRAELDDAALRHHRDAVGGALCGVPCELYCGVPYELYCLFAEKNL